MNTAGLMVRMTREERDFLRKQIDARMRERLDECPKCESARPDELRARSVATPGLATLDALEPARSADDPLAARPGAMRTPEPGEHELEAGHAELLGSAPLS